MQSMFRLSSPWSSEAPGDKFMEKAAARRPLPVVEIPNIPNLMNKLKRKQTSSPEPVSPQCAHVLKKWKPNAGEVKAVALSHGTDCGNGNVERSQPVDGVKVEPAAAAAQESHHVSGPVLEARTGVQPSRRESLSQSNMSNVPQVPQDPQPAVKLEPSSDSEPIATAEAAPLTTVQQSIEAQFNYEILLKHNELRLIEQELAKCQVALEQLRRCALIPFPGAEGPSRQVSGGVGAALQPPAGYTEPQHASPWGVTDGPYTRHYAKWLIPDARFDSMPVPSQAQLQSAYGFGEGRTTRGSFAEFASTGKARTSRTSTGTLKLQALGENPAPPPKVDQLLHKRSTDGQWVRLFCAQCGHSNFSNTQGFLNHCRIKHGQVFKSHDQAAIACGIPVDVDEAGTPIPATEPSVTTATPATASFPVPAAPGSVHPLIRANPAQPAPEVHRDFSKASRDQSESSTPLPTPNFEKEASMPHLSSLLAKRGYSDNFKGLVETARTPVDLSSMDTHDDDSFESGANTPVTCAPQQMVRVPSTNTTGVASKLSSARPGSKGNATGPSRLPHLPSPVNIGVPSRVDSMHMVVSPVELSPNTVDSNPGLVSDHDDDEDEDGYDARSQTDIIMDDNVVVDDGSDVEGVRERTDSRSGLEGCFRKNEGSHKH